MRGIRLLSSALLSAGLLLLAFGAAPAVQAQSNCSDAASCAASLDDSNPGDNQGGDTGADRDRTDSRDKPQ
ncbi:MAG TPA: hypothetical protein VH835_03185 [Dongiaceae bacterium]|jgi:hypothetical protein